MMCKNKSYVLFSLISGYLLAIQDLVDGRHFSGFWARHLLPLAWIAAETLASLCFWLRRGKFAITAVNYCHNYRGWHGCLALQLLSPLALLPLTISCYLCFWNGSHFFGPFSHPLQITSGLQLLLSWASPVCSAHSTTPACNNPLTPFLTHVNRTSLPDTSTNLFFWLLLLEIWCGQFICKFQRQKKEKE